MRVHVNFIHWKPRIVMVSVKLALVTPRVVAMTTAGALKTTHCRHENSLFSVYTKNSKYSITLKYVQGFLVRQRPREINWCPTKKIQQSSHLEQSHDDVMTPSAWFFLVLCCSMIKPNSIITRPIKPRHWVYERAMLCCNIPYYEETRYIYVCIYD